MEGRDVPSSHSSQIFLLATHTSHAAPPLVQAPLAHTCAVGVLDQRHEAWRGRSIVPVALPAEELGKVFLQ